MDVITTFSTILSSVKTATEIANILKESDLSLESAEAKLKIADLVSALADVKIQLADVRGLLIEKDDEIRSLKEKLSVKGNIEYEEPYYWLVDGGEKGGPFCISCYDGDGRLARLVEGRKGKWTCGVCGKVFYDKNYKPEQISRKGGSWMAF